MDVVAFGSCDDEVGSVPRSTEQDERCRTALNSRELLALHTIHVSAPPALHHNHRRTAGRLIGWWLTLDQSGPTRQSATLRS